VTDVATGLGRRLVRNTLLAATGRLVTLVSWWWLTPLVLRALGADGFAVWALFFALTGYLAALDLGIVQGTLRHVAAARQRGDQDEAGAFVTLGALGFGVLGLLWWGAVVALRAPLLAWLYVPDAQVAAADFALVGGAGVFVLAGLANVMMAALQGHDRFDVANGLSLAVVTVHAAGVLLALRLGAGLPGLVVAVGAGWAVGAVAGLVALRMAVPDARFVGWGAARAHVREALAFGGPMQIAGMLSMLHVQLDKFLLPGMVALAAVTPYELGSRVPGSLQTFPLMLLLAMLPAAASLHAAGDRARLHELFVRGSRYLLAASAVLVAALFVVADRLFLVWLGPGHAEAALVMRGVTLATGLALSTGMGTVAVRAIGRTDLEAGFAAIVLALHLVLSRLLIPTHGLEGAVVALLVANAIACPVFMLRMAHALGWSRREVLLKVPAWPVLATLVGLAASIGADRALGALAGWAGVAAVAGSGAMGALAVLLLSGQLPWRELRALLVPTRRADRSLV
jgi:O-antigen/teichoic acid export membrane protein